MLLSPPTTSHLSRMYYELSRLGARCVGMPKKWPYGVLTHEQLLALAAEMSRYDPRLFGIVTEYTFHNWKTGNPYQIRQILKDMQWPQTLCVVYDFVASATSDKECRFFYEYITRDVLPVTPQLFYLNIYPPGSHSMRRAVQEPIQEYLDWGYLARERPIIHGKQRQTLGHWGPQARKNIIRRIITQKRSISLSDYLETLDHTISRQQALFDLKESPWVKAKGKGRGSFWVKK